MSRLVVDSTKLPTATVCLSPYAGGMERDALWICRNMANLTSHSIMITRAGTWLEKKAKEIGLIVESVKMRGNCNLSGSIQLSRLWKKHNISNIVYLGSSEMPTIYLSLLRKDVNLIVRHGTTKNTLKKDFVHRLTWSKVTSHWCISQHILDNVKSIYPIAGKSLFVAYTSQSAKFPDIPVFTGSYRISDKIRLVHVGRLQEGKGQRDAIKVVSQLHKHGLLANLTLYGNGPDFDYLQGMVRMLGLSGYVKFMGEVEKPYSYLKDYDIFVFPSDGEGLPNAFLEALYSGIYCCCYENTVFPELFEMGLKFDMAHQGDYTTLAKKILCFFDKREVFPEKRNTELISTAFSLKKEHSVVVDYLF